LSSSRVFAFTSTMTGNLDQGLKKKKSRENLNLMRVEKIYIVTWHIPNMPAKIS